MKLYPYKPGSASAKALAEALGIKRIKHEGKALGVDCILNWGASSFKRKGLMGYFVFNPPEAVKKASNKLKTFRALEGHVSIPEWTTQREQALQWFAHGFTVVARTVLNGHSGEGIFIKAPQDQGILPEAPLYTKYVPKTQEYRIHVFRDNAFFVQRKARNKDVPDYQVNWKVRNHGNGFIFAHKDVEVRDDAKGHAIMAVRQLGLDFGAVDIIYNRQEDQFFVLEVNTACGLEGTTLEKYVEVFKEFV